MALLQETITGDTLASSHTVSVAVSKKLRKIGHVHSGGEEGPTSRGAVLGGVHVPEPVFFCSVEPASIVCHHETEDEILKYI